MNNEPSWYETWLSRMRQLEASLSPQSSSWEGHHWQETKSSRRQSSRRRQKWRLHDRRKTRQRNPPAARHDRCWTNFWQRCSGSFRSCWLGWPRPVHRDCSESSRQRHLWDRFGSSWLVHRASFQGRWPDGRSWLQRSCPSQPGHIRWRRHIRLKSKGSRDSNGVT